MSINLDKYLGQMQHHYMNPTFFVIQGESLDHLLRAIPLTATQNWYQIANFRKKALKFI